MAITPHPLIGFASEYMHWKALLRGFPLDGVLSTTTCDSDTDNRSDVISIYSEDGKPFSFQYNPKLDWDTELETREAGPSSRALN
jgi:hypothetical protein